MSTKRAATAVHDGAASPPRQPSAPPSRRSVATRIAQRIIHGFRLVEPALSRAALLRHLVERVARRGELASGDRPHGFDDARVDRSGDAVLLAARDHLAVEIIDRGGALAFD